MNLDNSNLKLETAAKTQLLQTAAVPAGLLERVLTRLAHEQNLLLLRNLQIKLWTAAGFMAAALAGLVASVKQSLSGNITSLKFLSLIFTDFGTVLHNWQDFSFSILESLPLMTMAAVLGAILISAVLAEYLICRWRDIKDIRNTQQANQLVS